MSKNPLAVIPEKRDMESNSIPNGLGWKKEMDKTDKDGIKASLSNARRLIMLHPYLRDLFGWSEMDEDVMLVRELPSFEGIKPPKSTKGYPCLLEDKYVNYLRDMLSAMCECNFNRNDILQACCNAAVQRPYNPIRTYLKSLTWDEEPRLTEWLTKGFGVKATALSGSMAFMFLIAAVRRVVFRRYKFDSMLVLEGEKGIRKSSGIRALFGDDYFLEGIGDIRKEQTTQLLAGMWGVEIPEGKGFLSADAATQKEFLSKEEDTYRRAYAVRPVTVPRTVVFVMTTNDYQYMIDGSGDRRFWPVLCGVEHEPDVDWIRRHRDQLWAEAFVKAIEKNSDGTYRYQTFMEDAEIEQLTEEQESRLVQDPWEEIIRSYFYGAGAGAGIKETTMMQIMSDAINIPNDRRDRSCQVKIGRIMKEMGWKKQRFRSADSRGYIYCRP